MTRASELRWACVFFFLSLLLWTLAEVCSAFKHPWMGAGYAVCSMAHLWAAFVSYRRSKTLP